jgi:hypothetical protein
VAAISPTMLQRVMQNFQKHLREMCWKQGTPPHRHFIWEVSVLIKMLWNKNNFSNKFK